MTAILRAALLAALTAASIPTVAVGQNVSADSLLRRIDSLQRRTADLERRVSELEALIKSEPSQGRPIPASTRSQDLANWRRLRLGMKMDEVRALLGEPARVEAAESVTVWYWANGNVQFSFDKLSAWSEPRR